MRSLTWLATVLQNSLIAVKSSNDSAIGHSESKGCCGISLPCASECFGRSSTIVASSKGGYAVLCKTSLPCAVHCIIRKRNGSSAVGVKSVVRAHRKSVCPVAVDCKKWVLTFENVTVKIRPVGR